MDNVSVRARRSGWLASAATRAMLLAPAVVATGISLAAPARAGTVNPVQTTTYNLNPNNNPITFGGKTDIDTTGANQPSNAVVGGTAARYAITNDGKLAAGVGGAGIVLGGAGSVTNAGSVSGDTRGVYFRGAGSVINQSGGSISGVLYGVQGRSSLAIDNQAGAAISAGVAIDAQGVATITNAGSIAGSGAVPGIGGPGGTASTGSVELFGGGTLTNAATGTITNNGAGNVAVYSVILATGASAKITNAGAITEMATGSGISLTAGGSVANTGGGAISASKYGVHITGGGQVSNAGSISGGAGSVVFSGAGANTLTLQTGSSLTGAAIGSAATGATNALVLQGTGTANNGFQNFGALTVKATGPWTLGGTSTIATTDVATGRLVVTGALTSAFTIDAGGTLQGGVANLLAQGTIADNGTLVFAQAGSGAFAGAIDGAGAIVAQTTGTLTLSGTSQVASTTVAAGTLNVVGALTSAFTIDTGATLRGGLGNLIAQGKVTDNGTLALNVATDGALANAVDGTGVVVKQGAGALTLSGSSAVGSVQVTAGSLNVTGALNNTNIGVEFTNASASLTNAGTISSASGNAVQLDQGGAVTNAAGAKITGATNGIYIKAGAGAVTNAGAITGTGGYGVRAQSGLTLQNQAGASISGGTGGVLVLGAAGNVTNAGSITGGGTAIALGSGAVTNEAGGTINGFVGIQLGNGSSTVTNAGAITGTAQAVFFTGSGSVTNGVGGAISGGTGIEAGGFTTVTVTNSGLIAAVGSAYSNGEGVRLGGGGSVVNNATGVITSSASNAIYLLNGPGTVTNYGKIESSAGYGVRAASYPTNIVNAAGATISGTNGVLFGGKPSTLSNAGTIQGTASGENQFVGIGVVASAGTITNAATGSITGGNSGVELDGTVSLANAGTISGGQNDGVFALGAATVTNAATGVIKGGAYGVLNIADAPLTITNSGQVSGGKSGVWLQGGGTVTNRAGGVISGGRYGIQIQDNALYGGNGTQRFGGAVTNAGTISGSVDSVQFTGAGTNVLTLQTGSVLNGTASGSTSEGSTNALILQGTGVANNDFVNFNTLVDQGPGPWTLGGTSAIGTTEVAGGSLIVTGALTSTFTIDTGATLQGGSGNLLAQGTVTDNGTLVFDQAAAGAFANAIDGTGAIVKQNVGALTLSGTSAVASTDVAAGTLIVTGPLTSAFTIDKGATLQGSSTTLLALGTVADNGTLVFDQAAAGTFANAVDGAGAIVKRNAGALTLSGTSAVASTDVAAGTLIVTGPLTSAFTIDKGATLQGSSATLLAQGTVTDNGALVFDQAAAGAFANAIDGTGSIVKQNAGALTLSGTSSVASTEVAAGKLIVTGALTSGFTIDAGATLQGGSANLLALGTVADNGVLAFDQAAAGTFANAIDGTGALSKQGVGALALGGVSSVATTEAAGGSLIVTGALTSAFTIDKGATLQGSSTTLLAQGAVADNGTLVFDQAAAGAFANAIDGTGAIVKRNAGALTLSATSAVASTDVAAGKLIVSGALTSAFQIDAGGTLQGAVANLLAKGTVIDNGTLVLDQATDATFANAIDGSGALVKQNAGVLTLSGTSTVASTEVAAGTLLVSGSVTSAFTVDKGATLQGAAANLAGSIADNGALIFTQASDGTFAGPITGSGAMTKDGAGALTLSGTSSVASTEIAAGSLIVTGSLTSAVTIDAGATLQGGSANLGGSFADNGTLVLDQAAAGTLASAINGAGVIVKEGVGLIALNGVSQVATTTVNAGNLQIGDAGHIGAKLTSAVTVNAGGTLSGHGTIVGAVTNAGGVVSPGGSIGVLTINGDYTQTSTGTLAIDVSLTDSSALHVTGTAHLAGALAFDAGPGVYRKGQQYDFLTAGAITGSFATISIEGPANFSISQEGDSFIATATAGNFALAGGATTNQRAIVPAFNDYPVGVSDFDPLASAILNLAAGPAQNLAVNELGSEVGPDLVSASRDTVRSLLGGLTDQLAARPASGGGSNDPVWVQAIGRFQQVSSDGNAHGFNDSAGGIAGGVQRDFDAATLGGSVSYDQTWVSLGGLPQSGNVSDVSLGLYGEERFGTLYADLGGLVGWDHNSEKRLIAAPGISRQASGGFDGMSAGVIGRVGDRISMSGGWTLEPRVGFEWSHVDQNAYTESGAGGADLAVGGAHQDAVQSLLGARVSRDFSAALSGEASLDWAHDFNDLTPRGAESFAAAPGTAFGIAGVNPGRDAALIRAGLNYRTARVTLFAHYDGAFSNRAEDNEVSGGLRIAF